MARALSTLAIVSAGIMPIYCFNLFLSTVRICSSKTMESLSSPSKFFTSVCIGNFAFVCVLPVIAAIITVGLWLDGSIIVLFVGHGEIGSCPIFSVGVFRLPSFGGSWRTAAHAYAYYSHKENVFGEWLFRCQRAVPFSLTHQRLRVM